MGKILVGVIVVLVLGGAFFVYRGYVRKLPPLVEYTDEQHLNNDVWTEAERQRYYHLSQGSQIMPYDWFVALEQIGNEEPFIADANMARFRIIPDPNLINNPDRLPIGFARDDPDPVTGVVNVGLTCAACHTSQMTYKGTLIRIDGAPGMVDLDSFLEKMLFSLADTLKPSILGIRKFDRFAGKVLKDKYNPDSAKRLRKYLDGWLKQKAEELASAKSRRESATKAGFGRIDALGGGGNRLYRLLGAGNLRTLNAPARVRSLWYTNEYNWVQTNGSIRQPMARNIIQALASNASLVFPGDDAKNDRYISSLRLNNINEMESMSSRFKAPVWPESVLGKIDEDAAKRGEALYRKHCAYCHEPKKENQPDPADPVAIQNNKTYFVLRLFPQSKVRTDPMDARNFAERTVDASMIGQGTNLPGAQIISMVLSGIIQRQYDELKLPVDEQQRWNGYRANLLRSCEAYPARPLAGVWANSPYLHNGSLPNLYQLLLREDQRVKEFKTGGLEFDPVNVGYVTTDVPDGFLVGTAKTGNSNAGHQYGTSLDHQERMDLIEFLKVLKFPEKDYELVAPQGGYP